MVYLANLMKESPVQQSIKQFLEWEKCIVLRLNSGIVQDARSMAWIHLQPSGTPDLLVGIPKDGYHIFGWIETKRSSGGKLRDDQIRTLRDINKRGTPWLVADSLEDAQKWLKDWTYHGDTKYTRFIYDESLKFIPTQVRRKKAKMTMATLHEFNRWAEKKDSDPAPF